MADSILDSPVFPALLAKYVQEAERVFRREAEAQGLVFTGEMLESIKAGAITEGTGFIEGTVRFDLLLRIRDLKNLHFSRMPPKQAQAAFEKWVEKHFNEFSHVPGYDDQPSRVSRPIAVRRIAQGIMFNRRLEPNVKRGYRGIYNNPMANEILPRLFYELRQAAGSTALNQLRLTFSD